jgi:hypothetical protein
MTGVFSDYPASVVRNAGTERELIIMRWAAQGWDRAGHATREVVVAQSPKLRSSNSSEAPGSNGNGMGCDLNDRKVHSAGGN